jgi:hypothetical protein
MRKDARTRAEVMTLLGLKWFFQVIILSLI